MVISMGRIADGLAMKNKKIGAVKMALDKEMGAVEDILNELTEILELKGFTITPILVEIKNGAVRGNISWTAPFKIDDSLLKVIDCGKYREILVTNQLTYPYGSMTYERERGLRRGGNSINGFVKHIVGLIEIIDDIYGLYPFEKY